MRRVVVKAVSLTLAWERKVHDNWGLGVAPHPFQTIVGTAGRDGQVVISEYNQIGAKELTKFDIRAGITAITFSRSGRLLVCGTRKGRILAWRFPSGEPFTEWRAHQGEITDLQFSPGDRYLVSASKDETAMRWEIDQDGNVRGLPFDGHFRWVLGVHCFRHEDRDYLVTSSFDCTAILWDLYTGELVRNFDGHEEEVVDARWCPSLTTLLTAGGDGSILAWNLEKDRPLWKTKLCKSPLSALDLISINDIPIALATGWDFTLHAVNVKSKKEVGSAKGFGTNLIHDLKVAANQQIACSIHADGILRAWNLK